MGVSNGPVFRPQARSLGYSGYPAFNIKQSIHRVRVLAALPRRLPPRTRTDFVAYKAQFRLPADIQISNFALLAYTEAKLPSDGFSIVNPLEGVHGPCQFMFEVAGYRHHVEKLSEVPMVGQRIQFVAEPTNQYDPNAVKMIAEMDDLIGYVNRLQAAAFREWIKGDLVEGWVERLNGAMQKPRCFVFVNVKQAA